MNIQEAKTQIKNALGVYFTTDAFGNPLVPVESQRPVFLMGPPGIGKTAIMAQIAGEMGLGLLSYSMTHHTRQSALGLPFITKKEYGGKCYDVSEYTMSEIIATVYELMETTGVTRGILFLDEMNCVSETLAPAMLQFLQYKTFGKHPVPTGWMVVAAGNPPEYNKSVREFDIVTWDRLKRIDITPDFDAWKSHAYSQGTHPAIMTYLDIKKMNFYQVETTVQGKQFVTARGWSDLSSMLRLYEANDIPVDPHLIGQYLQKPDIAKSFAIYYDLFNKYRSDYQIGEILAGKATPELITRAKKARFDERIALLGLLLDALTEQMREQLESAAMLKKLLDILVAKKARLTEATTMPEAADLLAKEIGVLHTAVAEGQKSAALSPEERRLMQRTAQELEAIGDKMQKNEDVGDTALPFDLCKAHYNNSQKANKAAATAVQKQLEHLFAFTGAAFGESNEQTVLVTELTVNAVSSKFIASYGSPEYFKRNRDLLLDARNQEIIQEIALLEESLG